MNRRTILTAAVVLLVLALAAAAVLGLNWLAHLTALTGN